VSGKTIFIGKPMKSMEKLALLDAVVELNTNEQQHIIGGGEDTQNVPGNIDFSKIFPIRIR
jgi:hypothetical protein